MSKELFRKSTIGSQHTVTNGAPNFERYEYLKNVFYKNELYKIFARPVILGRDQYGRPSEIRWMTDYEYAGDPVSLKNLAPDEQELIKGKVKHIVDLLYADAVRYMQADPVYKDLSKILDNCIEIPNDGCIYVLKVPDQFNTIKDEYILTQWGFINDDRKSATGIIKRWTGLRTKKIAIKVVYPDSTAAAGQNILVEYGTVEKNINTNNDGLIDLEDVPADISIHTYQVIEGEKKNINNLNTDERVLYQITIPKPIVKGDLAIILLDESGQKLPDAKIQFSYPDVNDSMVTNQEGKIFIKGIPENTPIKLLVTMPNNTPAQFNLTYSPSRPTETINMPPKPIAKSGPLTIKFIEDKDTPSAGLPVAVAYGGKKLPLQSNSEGEIFLTDVTFGANMAIEAKKGRFNYKGNIIHTAEVSTRVLRLKKKSRWWLWLLLALGVLVLLLLLWWLFTTDKEPVYKITVEDSSTHYPIQTADVELRGTGNFNDKTDGAGQCIFKGLSQKDNFLVSVSATGYAGMNFTTFGGKDTLVYLNKLSPSGPPVDSSFRPQLPDTTNGLVVHVIDAATGGNLNRADIHIDYQNFSGVSNVDGLFKFQNIPVGTHCMAIVTLNDYVPDTTLVSTGTENIVSLKPKVMYRGKDTVTDRNKGITSAFVWDIGDHTPEFTLYYNMYKEPDQLDIYCGKDTTGNRIFTTGGPVSYIKQFVIKNTCGARYVTVYVRGSTKVDPATGRYQTSWYYKLF